MTLERFSRFAFLAHDDEGGDAADISACADSVLLRWLRISAVRWHHTFSVRRVTSGRLRFVGDRRRRSPDAVLAELP